MLNVVSTGGRRGSFEDDALLALLRAIVASDHSDVALQLDASPELTTAAIHVGATRATQEGYFLTAIGHYVYRGDTALHIAAAAYRRDTAELLISRGADVRARNRRGAEPLHYAADGNPVGAHWDPDAQGETVTYLVENGADPNAFDKSGVAPLHRAVRTRSTAAVRALIDHGADPRLTNKSGSTPLHLAVQNTGRGHSGSEAAKEEQALIVAMLLDHGARPTDTDAHGKSAAAAASSDWIRRILDMP
jgi:ankyrin repeat protein